MSAMIRAGQPGREPGQQHCPRHEQHDFQPAAARPDPDVGERRHRAGHHHICLALTYSSGWAGATEDSPAVNGPG